MTDNGDKTLLGVAVGAGIVIIGLFFLYLILENRRNQQMINYTNVNEITIQDMKQRIDNLSRQMKAQQQPQFMNPPVQVVSPRVHNIDDTAKEQQLRVYFDAL